MTIKITGWFINVILRTRMMERLHDYIAVEIGYHFGEQSYYYEDNFISNINHIHCFLDH